MLVLVEQAARLQWFSNAESIDKQYLKRWRFCGCLGIVRLSRYKSWSLSAGDWGDWDDYDWKGSTASKSSKSGKSSKSYDSYDYSYGYGSYSSYKDNGTYDYKGQVGHAELWHWAIWAISVYLDILVKPTAPGFFCGFETVYIVYIYIFFFFWLIHLHSLVWSSQLNVARIFVWQRCIAWPPDWSKASRSRSAPRGAVS